MPIPDFQSLMLPVLRAAAEGEIATKDLRDRVASEVGLSESDLAEMNPSGRQTTFVNRTAWAYVFLQRAGLLEKVGRGVYRITDEGRKAVEGSPARIDMRFLERYPSYVEWRHGSASGGGAVGETGTDVAAGVAQTPEEQMDASYKALNAALEIDLVERVRELSPAFFENLIIELLIAMGYGGGLAEMGQAIGRAGDGGIDGIIKEDALGLDIVYVQAKRYGAQNPVGRGEVQSFAGSLDGVGATKGIFVTTSTFSQGAREFVQRITKRIVLVDGGELARLMIRHKVGVRIRTTYDLKKIDEDYFTE
jgi:restriction system protein